MKRKAKKTNGSIYLDDNMLAAKRMQAIEVASRLPEPRAGGMAGLGGGYPGEPGKSAAKVISDAEAIMAFVMKRA